MLMNADAVCGCISRAGGMLVWLFAAFLQAFCRLSAGFLAFHLKCVSAEASLKIYHVLLRKVQRSLFTGLRSVLCVVFECAWTLFPWNWSSLEVFPGFLPL